MRQYANRISFGGASVCVVILGHLNSPEGGMFLLVMTLAFFGAIQSGLSCVYMDVAPNFSSEINTVGNLLGAIAGTMGPITVSLLVGAFGSAGWRITFYITAGISAIALAAWAKYQTSDIIPELNTPHATSIHKKPVATSGSADEAVYGEPAQQKGAADDIELAVVPAGADTVSPDSFEKGNQI